MRKKSYSVLVVVIMLLTVVASPSNQRVLGSVQDFGRGFGKATSVTPKPLYFVATEIVRMYPYYNCCYIIIDMNISSYPLSDVYRKALGFPGNITQAMNITIPESMEVPWQINNITAFDGEHDANLTTTLPGAVPTSIANTSYKNTPDGTTITAHYLRVKNETNQPIRQPVREQFLNAVEQEQLHSLGLHIWAWNRHEMWGVGDQCWVHLEAGGAYMQVVGPHVIAIGPKDLNAALNRAGFILNKIGFIQLMLSDLNRTHGQEYTFNSTWTTNFILDGVPCNNTEELILPPKNWAVDFGNGTQMKASIIMATSQNVILQDTIGVTSKKIAKTEKEILEEGLLCYNVFNINFGYEFYSLSQLTYHELASKGAGGISDNWSWDRKIHLWDGAFTLAFTGITFDVKTSLDLQVYIGWKFEWFKLKWCETWMKLTASLLVNMTVGYEFYGTYVETLWSKTLYEWNTTYKFWVGPVPVVAELTFEPIVTIAVGFSAKTNIGCGVNATGSLKAGAGWKRDGGPYLIYDAEMSLDRTGPDLNQSITWDVTAWVTPSVKFRLALIFYYSAGPFVEFEPYITLGARYSSGTKEWTWWIIIGFNVNVGVTFTDYLKAILKLDDYTRTLWNKVLWMCTECTPAKSYDVELTEIRVPERRKAFVGESINIYADVMNKGMNPVDVNVILYARRDGESDWTPIGGPCQKQDLPTGNWTTFEFTWNTTGFANGNYTISANATITNADDENPEDNSKKDWTTLEIQDVTIQSVTTDKSRVIERQTVDITVVVKNTGTDIVSALPVSVCYNSNPIGDIWCEHTKWVFDLAAQSSKTLYFTWDTRGVANGTYKIKASAPILPYETGERANDNSLEDGYVTVIGLEPGDIAEVYGEIDIFDLVTTAASFGAKRITDPKDPKFGLYLDLYGIPQPSNADVNGDGTVDIFDLVTIAAILGTKY